MASDVSCESQVDDSQFREAMSRLGAGVTIISTDGPGGRAGITATAVASVTNEPPTLLICINREAQLFPVLMRNGGFCVNILSASQSELAEIFAGRKSIPQDARFGHGAWRSLQTGLPALTDCRAAIGCRISAATEIGTHSTIFGRIVELRFDRLVPPLLYVDRAYHTVRDQLTSMDSGEG